MQNFDQRVRRVYERVDEDQRLWKDGAGKLIRLRTWDLFDRLLPAGSRIADVGGGPGTHAAYLARAGHDVILFDPMPAHVAAAEARASPGSPEAATTPASPLSEAAPASPLSEAAPPSPLFEAAVAEARDLPLGDASVDVVLLMGPLYHLVERADRIAALREAARVLRPGGLLLAEIITRYAWIMDATAKGLLTDPETWDDFATIIRTGRSKEPEKLARGGFWAYFHRPDELRTELELAGYTDVRLLPVEGFAGLLDDLPARLREPKPLLDAIRLTENEASMLGASAHVLAVATT